MTPAESVAIVLRGESACCNHVMARTTSLNVSQSETVQRHRQTLCKTIYVFVLHACHDAACMLVYMAQGLFRVGTHRRDPMHMHLSLHDPKSTQYR